MINISDALREAALLARDFEDSPLWQIANVREGAITIQQQAERYAAAKDDQTRIDAATWAREGYQILSSALPETHTGVKPDERKTGWVTAHEIGKLFGPEFVWHARIRLEFAPIAPDSAQHNPSPEYLLGLIKIADITQRAAADRIGISDRLLRYYLADQASTSSRVAPYPVQYALEMLAR